MPRLLRACVIAVLLATAGVLVAGVVVPDVCASLDPNSFFYWLFGCGKDAPGGGGSGAA